MDNTLLITLAIVPIVVIPGLLALIASVNKEKRIKEEVARRDRLGDATLIRILERQSELMSSFTTPATSHDVTIPVRKDPPPNPDRTCAYCASGILPEHTHCPGCGAPAGRDSAPKGIISTNACLSPEEVAQTLGKYNEWKEYHLEGLGIKKVNYAAPYRIWSTK